MPHSLRRRAYEEQGFTLIELLVVILIVGILAAVAIPSFISQRAKGADAVAKSDARTAQTAMETYYVDHQTYGTDAAGLVGVEPSLGSANGLDAAGDSTTYSVSVTSKSSDGTTFTISRAGDGTISRSCDRSGQGGCDATGHW